jgi:hypothetical protein
MKHVLAANNLVLAVPLIQRFSNSFDDVDDFVDIYVSVSGCFLQRDIVHILVFVV